MRIRRRSLTLGVALVACLAWIDTADAQVGKNEALLNPNLAGQAELQALPGLTAELAGKILSQRPFLTMEALDGVLAATLSAEQREALYRRMWIPTDLNVASRQEILLIPSVGDRMLHEFEEYRPYRALAQFRREIGKYVDDAELARLEQYVYVRIDLNSASDEDILSIPGVGSRMLHEFKEYRPYQAIEQFRREMGKYVDEKEVARLERYVRIGG